MNAETYYHAYEKRYQAVYAAGAERWGHSPDEPELLAAISDWVARNGLEGKRVVEFACGEGAVGVILSRLGCVYHGVDISPSAVEKTKAAIAGFPHASVQLLDMVKQRVTGGFDAAVDCMGLHMIILDSHRKQYLSNAHAVLVPGAPMLFYRESYRENAYDGLVENWGQWLSITGDDYEKPELRRVLDSDISVSVPLVPGRARTKNGYERELRDAGFDVICIQELEINQQNPYSVAIQVRKCQ